MKQIKDFPGYFIDIDGNVYSMLARANQKPPKKPRKKSIWLLKRGAGYLCVDLMRNKKQHKRYIHRLLLETFIRPPKLKEQAMHLDGNSSNNSLDNLKWGTAKENQSHRIAHGTDNRGEKHGIAKLTANQVKKIRKLAKASNKKTRNIDRGGNYKKIGKQFGVSASTIGAIVSRRTWSWL